MAGAPTLVERVADRGWLAGVLCPRLSADPEFRRAAATLDGRISLVFGRRAFSIPFAGGEPCGVDRGAGVHGAKFGLRAADDVWDRILTEPRNLFLRHFHGGAVRVEGDLIEFLRLTEAVLLLVDVMRASAEVDA